VPDAGDLLSKLLPGGYIYVVPVVAASIVFMLALGTWWSR
jgi:hypothetical protein